MRLPFPRYIPLRPLIVFLGLLVLIQQLEGTSPVFSILMMIAQLAAAIAFNRLNGLTHMTGAFCLFSVLPNVTVPEIGHAILGQPGDYNVAAPTASAAVCAIFYLCIMIAAQIAAPYRSPSPYLDRIHFSLRELRTLSILSSIGALGIIYQAYTSTAYVENGSALSFARHFSGLLVIFSIVLGTYVRIRQTNGRSSMHWTLAIQIAIALIPGFLEAGKEALLTPLFVWVLVCAAYRYRFGKFEIAAMLGVLALAWSFVYPFAQTARDPIRAKSSVGEKIQVIRDYISNPSAFTETLAPPDESAEFGSGGSKLNIVQRYSLLYTIGLLVKADVNDVGYTDISAYLPALYQFVPHVLWPDRPEAIRSNALGHKAGFAMGEDDTTTGLSIGSPAIFFDLGGWAALMIYTLILFSLFFVVYLRVAGPGDKSIWGLALIGMNALLAGAASPSDLINQCLQVLMTFVLMVWILKAVSYVSQMFARQPSHQLPSTH